MELRKLFPRVLLAGLVLALLSVPSFAQSSTTELAVAMAAAVSEAPSPSSSSSSGSGFIKFQPLLMTAIDQRLGSQYRWGATGPNRFDCSGFVWSIFQASGINFERASARNLFARFEPVPEGEQFKFGTLVFFSGLRHVGVVVDEHGFYHASRHKGVIYSEFDEYWLKRIDGFRRVPLPVQIAQK
ncbi:MAG TPA: C40 family peptidase [Pyrinomonadaceae bacterium]